MTPSPWEAVAAERERQRFLGFERIGYTHTEMLAVLVEEVGEVANVLTEAKLDPAEDRSAALVEELVQVAAVAIQWLDRLENDWMGGR